MPPQDRFDRLEAQDSPLPEKLKAAVEKLDRFGHLEIGELKNRPNRATPLSERTLCPHCSQPNEPQRDVCWACFKPLKQESFRKPEPSQEIQLMLDGQTYLSNDPNLPDDIRMLMDRIREEGYSTELLREWRQWRMTRPAPQSSEINVFQGQRVSVIRIDGKVYRSDDPNITPEMKEIFDYVEKNGVTPELVTHLRRHGDKVKFRPSTTAQPTDGDIDFWSAAGYGLPIPPTVPMPPYARRRLVPLTFRQQLILLGLSVGIPAIIIIWVWLRYFSTIRQITGN